MNRQAKASPFFFLGSFLLSLFTLLLCQSIFIPRMDSQAGLAFSKTSPCSPRHSGSAQMTAFPKSVVQFSAQSPLATWRDLGEVQFRACAGGEVELHFRGHPVGGWGPVLRIVVNGRFLREREVTGDQRLSFPVTRNDAVRLVLLNYVRQAEQNYLSLQPQGGPWCAYSPPKRQGAAWIQPSGQYGDITGEGRLTFTACKDGKASFQFTRRGDQAGTLRVLVTKNDAAILDQALSTSRTVSFPLRAKDTLTIQAPGAKNQVTAERYLELRGIEFP